MDVPVYGLELLACWLSPSVNDFEHAGIDKYQVC